MVWLCQKQVYLRTQLIAIYSWNNNTKHMTVMPVILNWTGPQTVAQKGPADMVLFSLRSTRLKLLQLNYHTSFNIKTPMPVTLAWTKAQTVAPKLVPPTYWHVKPIYLAKNYHQQQNKWYSKCFYKPISKLRSSLPAPNLLAHNNITISYYGQINSLQLKIECSIKMGK